MGFVIALAALVSMAAISSAQPGYSMPHSDYDPWSEMGGWSGSWDDSWSFLTGYSWPYEWREPYTTTEPTTWPTGDYSDGEPTATRPGGYQPESTPSASPGSPISYLSDGLSLSEHEVSSLPGGSSLLAPGGPGSPVASGGPEVFRSYYGGTEAFRSYERYPNGYEAGQYWGYWYPGYRHAWFGADYKGWHQIAVWGSRSGWSNPIWVYVW
jgi:hypothetical protein